MILPRDSTHLNLALEKTVTLKMINSWRSQVEILSLKRQNLVVL